jgi:RNA polymerase sigma factor (sigma-70 family)
MGKRLEDRALVNRVVAGDREAFEELYWLYHQRVFGFALRRVSNAADAEDICQEVFLQIHRSIGSYQGRASLSTWIFGIAHNVTCRHFRKRGAPQVSLDTIEATLDYSYDPRVEHTLDACRTVDRCTRTLARQRTPDHLEIFRLFYGLGRPLRAISKTTGKPMDSVKDSLRRSRNLLLRDVPDIRATLAA